MRPGADVVFTPRTPRVVAARRLQRRRDRDATGRFLAEGPQAVREALTVPGCVLELFHTTEHRHPDLVAAAGDRASPVTDEALAALAETVQPQGIIAVCRQLDVPLERVLADRPPPSLDRPDPRLRRGPTLIAVCADIRDPGNAGTVLRTADAAGARGVVFAGEAVDPYNGKAVRASAGSLFHVDVVREPDPAATIAALHRAGLTVLAADAHGPADLDDLADAGALAAPTAWLFGSEAHGLPDDLAARADARVRVPIHGRAESLNLAVAAAICLYASARAQRAVRDR
jgi:TrmH family RNA methyltransferase